MARQPQYSLDERVFMVLKYHESQSPAEVIRQFMITFPNVCVPSRNTPAREYQKYLTAAATSRNLKNILGGLEVVDHKST